MKPLVSWTKKLTEKFSLDLVMFSKLRNWDDGIDFINVDISFDKYEADHKPSFQFMIVLLNYTIIELDIYNINHLVESEEV